MIMWYNRHRYANSGWVKKSNWRTPLNQLARLPHAFVNIAPHANLIYIFAGAGYIAQ